MTEPHAVRWAQRYNRLFHDTQWSKWHWTTNASFTLCGWPIRIGACDDCPLMPEIDDDFEQVDCKICKRKKVVDTLILSNKNE